MQHLYDPGLVELELSVNRGEGERLTYRAWRPRQTAPRAVVLIVPGFKSYSGRYRWAGSELAKAGFAVYAVDLRGRGNSEGKRFDVADFEEYLSDVEAVAEAVRAKEGTVPLFIAGHSAGAVTALLFALRHGPELAGAVAMSIAQELPAPGLVLSAFKLLSHVLPGAPVLKLKSVDFTQDPGVLASMNADPLIAGEVEPLQSVAALVRAGERLRADIEHMEIPVLFLHGTEDHAARTRGSERLYAAAGSADKSLRLYPGVRHEPLADVGRETVLEDIILWLEPRVLAAQGHPARLTKLAGVPSLPVAHP